MTESLPGMEYANRTAEVQQEPWPAYSERERDLRTREQASQINQALFFFAAIVAFILEAAGIYWLTAIGVGVFVWLLARFVREAGKDIPVETLALLLAALQWVVGPLLYYEGLADHYKYFMYVDQQTYMNLAVPALICYVTGMLAFRGRDRTRKTDRLLRRAWNLIAQHPYVPYWLVAGGLAALVLQRFAPPSLGFLFYLLSGCAYIGVIYLLFSPQRKKWVALSLAVLLAAIGAVQRAMFFNSMLWISFIGLYAAIIIKPRLHTKLLVLLAVTIVVVALQGIKAEYRRIVWKEGVDNRLTAFAALIGGKLNEEEEDLFGKGATEATVIRINQGWIISRIMHQVPRFVPFAEGKTIWDDIRAALVPRILDPNKPVASGREYYQRFTGFSLTGTSMGIGTLGESYANFGVLGSCVCLFIYGCLIALTIRGLYRLADRWPTLILWFPLMFLHVVKAEAEFLTVINYCVRGAMVTLAVFWFCTHVLHWKM